MTDDKKEVEHRCTYVGPHDNPAMRPIEKEPTPPSAALAQTIALGIFGGTKGRIRRTVHFGEQLAEREFDVFDVEYVIRNGRCVEDGIYCQENQNFKYTFRGCIDGVDFDAVFALSAEHDLLASPLMILITGCWKTKSGKRSRRY